MLKGKVSIIVSGFLIIFGVVPFPSQAQTPEVEVPFSEVANTPHDLSLSSTLSPCRACHTGGDPIPSSPNKNLSESVQKPIWGGKSISDNIHFPTQVEGLPEKVQKRPLGSSYDCLSCHDGVVAMDSHKMDVRKEANSEINSFMAFFPGPFGGPADTLFQSLDHPVSIVYPRKPDGRFVGSGTTVRQLRYWSVPDLTPDGVSIPSGPHSSYLSLSDSKNPSDLSYLVRTVQGRVECDSCHNPHTNQKAAFLRETGHTLCLICHDR